VNGAKLSFVRKREKGNSKAINELLWLIPTEI